MSARSPSTPPISYTTLFRSAPLIRHNGRGEAEGHQVRQAVVLLAEEGLGAGQARHPAIQAVENHGDEDRDAGALEVAVDGRDRKSTRLNFSHLGISYAVFCL